MSAFVRSSTSQAKARPSRRHARICKKRWNYSTRPPTPLRFANAAIRRYLLPGLRLRLGRLRVCSGREVCALLAQRGFLQVRRKGSHIIMQKRDQHSTITVPVPDHAELKIGTLLSIIVTTA